MIPLWAWYYSAAQSEVENEFRLEPATKWSNPEGSGMICGSRNLQGVREWLVSLHAIRMKPGVLDI